MTDKNKKMENAKRTMEEFEMAWQKFFKDKPKPKNDEEERKEQEEFHHWYNYIRKQSDTGKTPAEMYTEIYGEDPSKNINKVSRIVNFEWDEDYDEEMIGLIYELQEYDNEEGYTLNYEAVKKKLTPTINKLIKKGEKAIDWLHELLKNKETWSCIFSLEILKEIKSEKSIPHLIRFIEKNQDSDYFENCDEAIKVLINIGAPCVRDIIKTLKKGLEKNIYDGYLFETLSKIKDKRSQNFKLKILRDYLACPEKYQGWFELTHFLYGFKEEDKEALTYLKKLQKLNLEREEKKELESAIQCIEDPKAYKRKQEQDFKRLKPLIEEIMKRNTREY